MIQTGCEHVSEDIEAHRQIQGLPTDDDTQGLTCPYIFTYPCFSHMAAAKDGRRIDLETIKFAKFGDCERPTSMYYWKGAGGLMVPNDMESLTIDYVKEQAYSA